MLGSWSRDVLRFRSPFRVMAPGFGFVGVARERRHTPCISSSLDAATESKNRSEPGTDFGTVVLAPLAHEGWGCRRLLVAVVKQPVFMGKALEATRGGLKALAQPRAPTRELLGGKRLPG